MILAAVTGYPLAHSQSPALFRNIFRKEGLPQAQYIKIPLKDISTIREKLKDYPDIIGFNVTIPHKVTIIPHLDNVAEHAQAIGAVNTVSVMRNTNGRLYLTGYNSDVDGFKAMMEKYTDNAAPGALVLGSGGVSKAVSYVLRELHIPFFTVSRYPSGNQIAYRSISSHLLRSHPLIVNCTPAGMYPQVQETPPLPFYMISQHNTILDLVYEPPETLLMKNAAKQEAQTFNGMLMLQQQAQKAWEIWKKNHSI